MKASIAVLALGLAACGNTSAPPPAATAPAQSELPANGAFVGRVWVSAMPGSALGSMLVFLPDRSLLMDSCFETYRISKWGVAGDRIRWMEDSIPIEAEVSVRGLNELRIHIVGREDEQTYVSATVPYVCPDMPR